MTLYFIRCIITGLIAISLFLKMSYAVYLYTFTIQSYVAS